MSEKIKLHDFIELDYTGKLTDGTIFDTTLAEVAKKNNFYSEKTKYGSMKICVGEAQILPGLDGKLIDKEIGQEYTIPLSAEEAFGKRDIKNMRIIPMSNFIEHKMQPYPGLQIDVDGDIGIVSRVSGGRVMVNFNHPLAGKDVVYEIKIKRFISDKKEQLASFFENTFKVPADKIKVELKEENNEEKAEVKLPFELPPQFFQEMGKRLAELTGLKEVNVIADKEVSKELPAKETKTSQNQA